MGINPGCWHKSLMSCQFADEPKIPPAMVPGWLTIYTFNAGMPRIQQGSKWWEGTSWKLKEAKLRKSTMLSLATPCKQSGQISLKALRGIQRNVFSFTASRIHKQLRLRDRDALVLIRLPCHSNHWGAKLKPLTTLSTPENSSAQCRSCSSTEAVLAMAIFGWFKQHGVLRWSWRKNIVQVCYWSG